MNEMRALIVTEAKLLFREPVYLAGGDRSAVRRPADLRRGVRARSPIRPSAASDSSTSSSRHWSSSPSATLGIQTLPIRLATYREKGVLRRLSTTPAHPCGCWPPSSSSSRDRGRRPRAPDRRRDGRVRRPVPQQPDRLRRRLRCSGMSVAVRDRPGPRGRRAVLPGGDGRRDPAVLRGDVPGRRVHAAGATCRRS